MDIIDVGLYASYLLIGACALAAIVIPLIQSFGDPQTLIKSGLGLGVILVVFLVGYALADNVSTNPKVSETAAKLSGAGIISMYLFFCIALVGIVYTEISKLIK